MPDRKPVIKGDELNAFYVDPNGNTVDLSVIEIGALYLMMLEKLPDAVLIEYFGNDFGAMLRNTEATMLKSQVAALDRSKII